MKISKYLFLSIFLSAIFRIAVTQELRGLTENPVIKQYLQLKPGQMKAAKSGELLTLPFFEDFSTSNVIPDPLKWADADAFINNSFAVDPMSLGVATLDAIDANGEVYSTNNLPVSSDKLTSQPFDLSPYKGSVNKVTISFFYQAGGKGEAPEKTDSLSLEFYSPSTGLWQKIWWALGDSAKDFKQVITEVPDTFYQAGFRFRFRNSTTLSSTEVAGGKGALSNADCWNIDYIMMNTLPEEDHRNIEDITLVDIPRKLLDFYETVPWSHLSDAQTQSITQNDISYKLRYITTNVSTYSLHRYYKFHDLFGDILDNYEVGISELAPDTVGTWYDPFYPGLFQNNDSPEGAFEITEYIVTTPSEVKQNDTARTTLYFKNYYAYDDGTPEYGFGISGESSSGALLAIRFRTYRTDTLRAIQMMFNKTRDHENADKKFHICVWKDLNGSPSDLLYMSDETYIPGEDAPFNGFNTYPLPDTGIVITDTSFFVGWKQVSEDFLNLGYDVNRNTLSRVFVNITGNWFSPGSSLLPGTPMIRAVFGKPSLVSGDPGIPSAGEDIEIYPNPASTLVHIHSGVTRMSGFNLTDMQGRILIHENSDTREMDVSAFPSGIYLLQIKTGDGRIVNRKLIIRH